jgi:hypothetical protein
VLFRSLETKYLNKNGKASIGFTKTKNYNGNASLDKIGTKKFYKNTYKDSITIDSNKDNIKIVTIKDVVPRVWTDKW